MKEFTIFYADDDEDDLMFFEEAVDYLTGNEDYRINLHLIKNGKNLVEIIRNHNNDESVVFLDLNMPHKSGFDLLKEMRSIPETSTTPVIIYSTSSNDKNISTSLQLGANFYAVKPYNYDDLMKLISNATRMNWKNHKTDLNNFLFNNLTL